MTSLVNLDEIFLNLVSEKYFSDKNPFSFNSGDQIRKRCNNFIKMFS